MEHRKVEKVIFLGFWENGSLQGKVTENVNFHDFFKLFLNDPRCCPRHVEMFLRPLEDILNLRTHF